MEAKMPDCLGPYIGSGPLPDLKPFDFVVLNALDGMVQNDKFNVYLDVAYRLNKPVIAVIKIDTSYYSTNTLGLWPPEEDDRVFRMIKKMFLMPDGKSRYTSINAVLIDMRSYYDNKGGLIGGAWITGVVIHIRDFLTRLGFKTYILTDNKAVALYPNPAGAVATYLSKEKVPVAVQQNEQYSPKLSIPWAPSAFLWWFGSKFVGETPVAMFRCIFVKDALYQFLGFKPTVPVDAGGGGVIIPPVVIDTVPTEIQLLQSIDLKLSKIMTKLGI
jgi:hypothetical protein